MCQVKVGKNLSSAKNSKKYFCKADENGGSSHLFHLCVCTIPAISACRFEQGNPLLK